MKPPVLSMSGVTVCRNGRIVLNVDDLVVGQGEILSIIGTNGAGKSTLLQAANLLLPANGRISLFGQAATPKNQLHLRRRSALLFQEALFTYGTVYENVALPLKLRGVERQEINGRVEQVLKTVRCEYLSDRQARKLSGGEAQRISLARALVSDPELLLLDEPFSALDPASRSGMLSEFRQIILERGITALVVSHSMDDILFLGGKTVVFEQGRIVQQGAPEEILRRPASVSIARLTGMDNIIPCRLELFADRTEVVLINGYRFQYPGDSPSTAEFCCFPGDIFGVCGEAATVDRCAAQLEGRVGHIVPGIGIDHIFVETGSTSIRARIPRNQFPYHCSPGDKIKLTFNPRDVHLL